MVRPRQRKSRPASLVVALLFVILSIASFVPASRADAAIDPQWRVTGTRWDVPAGLVSDAEADRFVRTWTARFLVPNELEAYLNRTGLYDDGFDNLSDDAKAGLIVRLIEHWQATLPDFGSDVWTGDAAKDQKTFEELALLLHAVIFEKDGFIGKLKAAAASRSPAPTEPVDAGIPQFPGMSQEQINANYDKLHEANRVIKAPPATEAPGVERHLAPPPPVVDDSVPAESLRVPIPALLENLLSSVPELAVVASAPPEALIQDLLDAGMYLACGSFGNGPVTCAPTKVPLGTPVPLDLDGAIGPEVVVQLTPTQNPDFLLTSFAASLTVRSLRTPMPAQVYVIYRVVPAELQVLAGFDAREDTLGDVQEARVTVKDTAAALAGDVRLRAEITRSGPGRKLTLLAEHARTNPLLSDPSLSNPTRAAIRFDPVPNTLRADLSFYPQGTQSVIEGALDASSAPSVTTSVAMDRGSSRREMVTIIDQLPTHLDFKIVSGSGSATNLTYNANATIPRVRFSDVVIPSTATPSSKTTLAADVRGIPSTIGLTINPPFNIAYTASSRVTSATVATSKYDAQGLVQSFASSVSGIPSAWSITGVSDPLSISYSANGAIDSLATAMYDRASALSASATATGIPRDLRLDVDDGLAKFSASAPIASITGSLSKRGLIAQVPAGANNHLSVAYTQSASGPDFVGASFKMSQVSYVEYKRSGQATYVDLRMGGGAPFAAQGDLNFLTGERAYLYATLSALPSSIQATFGEATSVTTNANPDLYAYAEYGTQAARSATPTPPTVHGMALRDGASGTARAIKASVWLTGLPTALTIDSRNNVYSLTNWRPSQTYLVADVELDNLVSPALDAYVQLNGIPSPQSLAFSMKTEDLTGGGKRTRLDLTQSAPMGSLWADTTFGVNHGHLEVSNIPDDIHVAYTLQNGQSTLAWDATAAIANVYAAFRVVPQSASYQGYVSLTQLPADFTLTFGRDPSGNGPTLAYSASASTLDANAYADASLFGGDLKARLSFGMTDLGATTNVYASGSGIRFTSSPATNTLYANVWGSYNYYRSGSGVLDEGGFLEFPWAYHIGVSPTVNNLAVTLTGFSDFSLTWGVTSKLAGAYSQFSFGWSNMSVYLDLYGYFAIRVDWPWPFGSSTITLVDFETHQTIPVNVQFHKYTNHEGPWFSVSGWAICDWSLTTTLRPHPHGTSMNGVSVSSQTAEGGAWYVVPNPYGLVPSWGVDLAARYTSPDGGSGPGLDFDYSCW